MGPRGIVSVGPEVDLAEASRVFRDTILMGNVDPLLLRDASPDAVRTAAARCVEEAGGHPAGFVLAPGCELQMNVPEPNLRAMIAAARPTAD